MLTILYFVFSFGLILAFGYKLAKVLLSKGSQLEQFSVGFVLGSGIFTFIWFLMNLAGIPYSLQSGFGLLVGLYVAALLLERLFGKKKKKKGGLFDLSYFKNLNMIEKSLLVFLAFICISALIQTIYWPIRYWDSLVLYDFRAKIFASTGLMGSAIATGQFFGYPLLTSLMHTWIYLLGLTNPSFYYTFLYVFLIIIFFENVKKFNINRTLAIFLTLFVAVSPRLFDHTQWGYTNLPYTVYIVLGSIYLYWSIKNKDFGEFLASAILVGLSTWTRSAEPFWLSCLVVGSLSAIYFRKWIWPILYTAILASVMLPWRIYQSMYERASVNVAGQVVSASAEVARDLHASIFVPAFNFVIANVVLVYFGYFVVLGVILLIKLFRKSKKWLFTTLVVFDFGLTLAGTMIFVKNTSYWQSIPDSLSRMVMFMPVMIIFLSAELLTELKNR